MKVVVVTKIPSPYQVELFDRLTALGEMELEVLYLRRSDPDRSWRPRQLGHLVRFMDDTAADALEPVIDAADLVVFSWYRDPVVRMLMRRRARSNRPWCFWGERPGFTHQGIAGRLFRRAMLWSLYRRKCVPIWGIGQWAVEGYRAEFGSERTYFSVPYASDLQKFFALPLKTLSGHPRVILFSGTLIERKGIEELCDVICDLAKEMPDILLKVMGDGPLASSLKDKMRGVRQIQFLGFRDWDELQAAYAEADILCAPSRYDGWGLIVLEGMAAGLPVVASTAMGSAFEAITVGKTGWTAKACDTASLEAALKKALTMPGDDYSRLSLASRECARRYDVENGAAVFYAAAQQTVRQWR